MGSLLQGRLNLSVLCEPERNVNDGHGDMLCINLTSNRATGSLEGHVVGGNRPEDALAGRRPESTQTPEKEDGEKPPPRAGGGEQCSLPPGPHAMITSCVILILIAYNKH